MIYFEFFFINDFGGVDELNFYVFYNWGYNLLLFNVSEGGYFVDFLNFVICIVEVK